MSGMSKLLVLRKLRANSVRFQLRGSLPFQMSSTIFFVLSHQYLFQILTDRQAVPQLQQFDESYVAKIFSILFRYFIIKPQAFDLVKLIIVQPFNSRVLTQIIICRNVWCATGLSFGSLALSLVPTTVIKNGSYTCMLIRSRYLFIIYIKG